LGTEEKRGTTFKAAHIKFLRHLLGIIKYDEISVKRNYICILYNCHRMSLGITKLDKGKNQCIKEQTGVQNTIKVLRKTIPEKLATTRREDGHRQNTKTSTAI
jgi:hypothetical protein